MRNLSQTDISYFQDFNDFQENSPHLTTETSLLKQNSEKMPAEKIDNYLFTLSGQETEYKVLDSDSKYENIAEPDLAQKPVYIFKAEPLFERSIALQKWQGIVTEIYEDRFLAKLINLTDEGYDEEADFSFDEITHGDLNQIKEGAVFYWTIGYQYSRTGQKTRMSHIRFRRLPVWSDEEIRNSRSEGLGIANEIGWK